MTLDTERQNELFLEEQLGRPSTAKTEEEKKFAREIGLDIEAAKRMGEVIGKPVVIMPIND